MGLTDCDCRSNGVHNLGDDDCWYSPPGWTVGVEHLLAVADAAVVESARRRAERDAANELARPGQEMRLDD